MSAPVSLVMTLIGKDRPGLVQSLSAIIDAHAGNWEESRMVHLAGEFAGLLRIQVSQERAGELERELEKVEGLSVVVARDTHEKAASTDVHYLKLEVVGQDHPGIVHHVADAVVARGINIEELETGVRSAPMSGEQLFHATARLRAPTKVTLEDLEHDLEALAADLMVEVRLEE